jgi:adenylyltransferase/sulfurtransferase
VRDDQVRRYARHILLPDVGGLGQTALLRARARIALRERDPDAELIAATYLAAGGVGGLDVPGASPAQVAALAAAGPDTAVTVDGLGTDVPLQPLPAWWPGADGDALAVAHWRGGLAAVRWMATIANG